MTEPSVNHPSSYDDLPLDRALALTTGADYWTTAAAPEIGLRSLRMADGPHGLRVQNDENPDHLGLNRSLPATCFPPAVTLASSWDPALALEIGAALGREARAVGVDIVLGPGLNIKRSPLCGRNFEYFSEDPLLSGIMAGGVVSGLQSVGVAACLKHFAANNQETDRQRINALVDERTLHEIYLRSFEIAVRESDPWAIMSSYNRVNGTYASENSFLLTDVLRQKWGWQGLVLSDWGAVHEPAAALAAGLDLRMPGRPDDPRLLKAATEGLLDQDALRRTIARLQLLAERTSASVTPAAVSLGAHHELVRRAAAESAVLLANDQALPLDASSLQRMLVVGELAQTPRYQGAGSSAVTPPRVVSGWEALTARAVSDNFDIDYAAGYSLASSQSDDALVDAAIAAAAAVEVVVVFAGLPDRAEAEGRDRSDIDLPKNQRRLLRALADVDTTVVVVLSNGSAVTTAEWRDGVAAILDVWLTGQAHGDSVTDLLFGDINPSGKLAETIPVRLEDAPSYLNFPGEAGRVLYGEGVHVGYRGYDAVGVAVDYPFGHGLSYTTFEYSDLAIDVSGMDDEIAFRVALTVTNTGPRDGAEIVQVYVADRTGLLHMPAQELRAFAKIRLRAGASHRVHLPVRRADLAHYSVALADWAFEGGDVEVRVGASSRDIRLARTLTLPGRRISVPVDEWSTLGEWLGHPTTGPALEQLLAERGGITGRMADLLSDEGGRDSVLSVPLVTLIEFPGVPISLADAHQLAGVSNVAP